jgi:hypothetical protein
VPSAGEHSEIQSDKVGTREALRDAHHRREHVMKLPVINLCVAIAAMLALNTTCADAAKRHVGTAPRFAAHHVNHVKLRKPRRDLSESPGFVLDTQPPADVRRNVGLTSDSVTMGACRLDSLICSVALSGQAPQPRSGAPKAQTLRGNAHTKRPFLQGDARLQAPQPRSGAPKARSLRANAHTKRPFLQGDARLRRTMSAESSTSFYIKVARPPIRVAPEPSYWMYRLCSPAARAADPYTVCFPFYGVRPYLGRDPDVNVRFQLRRDYHHFAG